MLLLFNDNLLIKIVSSNSLKISKSCEYNFFFFSKDVFDKNIDSQIFP